MLKTPQVPENSKARILDDAERLTPGAEKLLRRCDEGFSEDERRALARLVASERVQRQLSKVGGQIHPSLVRQFHAIPESLRIPSILRVANALDIPASRWQRLAAALAKASAARRATLRQKAARISGGVAFWDFANACEDAANESVCFSAGWPELPPPFEHLGTPAAMRREARAMRNCLAERVRSAARGTTAYYRYRAPERLTVVLALQAGRWHLVLIAGSANGPVSELATTLVRDQLRAALGESVLEAPELGSAASWTEAMEATAAVGREEYSIDDHRRLAAALQQIRGRSTESAGGGAYCIFEIAECHFVQFLSLAGRQAYLVEIVSHRYQKSVANYLTVPTVELIEACEFAWPGRKENFAREMAVLSDADCERLADFALGLLARVFGHKAGQPIDVACVVPPADVGEDSAPLGQLTEASRLESKSDTEHTADKKFADTVVASLLSLL